VIFKPTRIVGAFEIEPERVVDERGFFARTFCRSEFADQGLTTEWVQCSISFSTRQGTLRGMHYQVEPYAEAKLVRCTRGAIYDVILDLRRDSPTFRRWSAAELSPTNRRAVYVPPGCAHGFQTLEDETEVLYQMSRIYHPQSARGVRWDDRAFGIEWPDRAPTIASRDRDYPDFEP